MNYKDHVIANRNTTERIKTAVGHSAPPPSRTKRTLSPSTNDSSPTCIVHDSDNNTAQSSPTKDLEHESSNCTICLNTYEDRAVLETCQHEFCFSCIIQWSTLSHTCPLCIRPFTSCLHEIQDDHHYTVHQFEPLPDIRAHSGRPTASDTTVPHGIIRRLYGPPQFRRRGRNRPLPPETADEQSVADRQQAALENRRNVYRNGLFVRHVGANRISGFQQITPETFRIFPQRLDHLVPWIRRELQAITTLSSFPPEAAGSASTTRTTNSSNEETDSGLEIIREYIIAVCKRYDLQTDQGQDLIRDFLHDHTEHFVHELMGFARSPFSMEAYDRAAQYSSPSTSSSTAATGTGDGDIQRVINDEGSIDRKRRERPRRRHESPDNSGRARGVRDIPLARDEKRSRSDHDRETQSYSRSEDRESTGESTASRSSRHAIQEANSPALSTSSSRKPIDARAKVRLANKIEMSDSSTRDTPNKTDLQAILKAKLKREQDLYASRNNQHP